jgi:hypothetical protein
MSLLDKASLIVTPNAYKESKLYSVIPSSGAGDMDVVRATTATRVNSAGLIEVVPRNLLQYSEQFENAAWVKSGVTITANTTVAPNGTTTASKIIASAVSGDKIIYQIFTTSVGIAYTVSAYYKSSEYTQAFIRFGGTLNSPYVIYDLTTQTIVSTSALISSSITLIGNGWYKITATAVTSSTNIVQNIMMLPSTGYTLGTNNVPQFTGNNTSGGFIWGSQCEVGSTATEYFPTTTRLNIPRIDYTNGSCPSLLVEPQRTNVILQSGDLSQTVWSKSNYTLSSAVSIQGLTSTRITKNAINNGVYNGTGVRNVVNTIGTFASGIKTLSFLIRKGNTDKVAFLINNVLVGVLTSVNCEFNFITKTFTNVPVGLTASFENPATDIYKIILTINDIGTSTGKAIWIAPIDNSNNTVDGGYLDFAFAQWETGSYATSYIPTVASTVTRNADLISNNNLISKGLIVNDYVLFLDITNPILGNQYILDSTDISSLRTGILRVDGTTASITDITGGISLSILNILTIGKGKMCVKRTGSTLSFFANGVKALSTTTTTVGTINNLKTGVTNSTTSSYINSVVLFPIALTDTECINLTTL